MWTIILYSVLVTSPFGPEGGGKKYRIVTIQPLDKQTYIAYSAQTRSSFATEHYRLRDRIEHYGPTEENRTREQATGIGHRGINDHGSSRRLQRQRADDLPSDQERQAQGLSAQQRLSYQA